MTLEPDSSSVLGSDETDLTRADGGREPANADALAAFPHEDVNDPIEDPGDSASSRPDVDVHEDPEDLRELPHGCSEIRITRYAEVESLSGELAQLRETGAELAAQCRRIDVASRAAEERVRRTAGAIDALEKDLDRLDVLHDLAKAIDDQLKASDESVARLERRTTDAITGLAGQIENFEAREQDLERLVAQVKEKTIDASKDLGRLDVLHDLGKTIDDRLKTSDESITRLERRAASAIDGLAREIEGFEARERALEQAAARVKERSLEASLQLEREMKQLRTELERLAEGSRVFDAAAVVGARRVPEAWWYLPRRRSVAGGLVVIALLAVAVAIPSSRRSVALGSARPESDPSLPAPLASRSWRIGPFSVPTRTAPPLASAASPERDTPRLVAAGVPLNRDVTPSHSPAAASTKGQASAANSAAAPLFVGALEIDSKPSGAAVFVNRQPAGRTPVRLDALRAGSHVVRIEHAGYQRWSASVLVSAVKETHVSATLQPDR